MFEKKNVEKITKTRTERNKARWYDKQTEASHRSLGTITKQFKYLVERAVEKEIYVKPGNFSLW